MTEAPKSERFPTQEKAAIEIYGKSGQVVAEVKNMSQTGACIEWGPSDVELKQGDLLRLTFVLSALKKKHFVNAEVIWRSGNRSGISFVRPEQLIAKMTIR